MKCSPKKNNSNQSINIKILLMKIELLQQECINHLFILKKKIHNLMAIKTDS